MEFRARFTWFAVVALVLSLPGCAGWQKRRALEAAARDWCFTIRASQILPVYPLSEDVQPGDLYLVQLPIDRQQEAYRKDGFLPLDNLIDRIDPTGYAEFYQRSFRLGSSGRELPGFFLGREGANWKLAPTAAFPSYAFSVRSGAGANVAIPVSGVPVGLSLMNSGAAAGTITIADVRTYGVDTISLADDVESWSRKTENANFLAQFEPREERGWLRRRERRNYLRVVSRVFATRKVNVSLVDSSSGGGKVSAGVPRTIELATAGTGAAAGQNTAANYKSNVDSLNAALEEALEAADSAGGIAPGGSLQVVAASSRSISLVETFAKPLVIGYLGFDMEIEADGKLGPPIPTYALVAQGLRPGTLDGPLGDLDEVLRELDVVGRPEVYAGAAAALGSEVHRGFQELEVDTSDPRNHLRMSIAAYLRSADTPDERTTEVVRVLRVIVDANRR